MMGWSRNLNYIGEILIYASFGIMCQRWEPWAIYSFNWGVIFVLRMILKDYSNSKKAGWQRLCKIGDNTFRWSVVQDVSPDIKREKRRLKKKARKEKRKVDLNKELCDLITSAGYSNARANVHNDPNIL